MLVANGQGLTAVNRPSRKAVIIGISLLSNNVCKYSIKLCYFSNLLIFCFNSFLNTVVLLRAF